MEMGLVGGVEKTCVSGERREAARAGMAELVRWRVGCSLFSHRMVPCYIEWASLQATTPSSATQRYRVSFPFSCYSLPQSHSLPRKRALLSRPITDPIPTPACDIVHTSRQLSCDAHPSFCDTSASTCRACCRDLHRAWSISPASANRLSRLRTRPARPIRIRAHADCATRRSEAATTEGIITCRRRRLLQRGDSMKSRVH